MKILRVWILQVRKNFIEAVKNYCIKVNQSYTCRTSNKIILDLICSNSGGWKHRARQKYGGVPLWTIVTYKGRHASTCVSDNHTLGVHHLNSSVIDQYLKSIRMFDWIQLLRLV